MNSDAKKRLCILSAIFIVSVGFVLALKNNNTVELYAEPEQDRSGISAHMDNTQNQKDEVKGNLTKKNMDPLVDSSGANTALSSHSESEKAQLSTVEEDVDFAVSDINDSLSQEGILLDKGMDEALPDELSLWDLKDSEPVTVDGIPATQTRLSVNIIKQLKVGQSLSFSLPGAVGTLTSTLDNASNPMPGISVYRGKVDIAGATGDVIVSQGEIETQFIITTPATVYSVAIDNATGKAVIIDEAEYASRTLPDTPAQLDPGELLPPPS